MSLRAVQVFDGEGIAPPPAPKPVRVGKRVERIRLNVDDIGYELCPTSLSHKVLIKQTYSGRWMPSKLGSWTFDANDEDLQKLYPDCIVLSPGGSWHEWFFTRKTLREFIHKACR